MSKELAIGAGHSFNTPGKRTPDGVREWTMNNGVVNRVIAALKDYDVVIHRTDDETGQTDVPLSSRTSKVRKIMPDLYIEVHHNANTGSWGNWTGFEVYFMGKWQSLANKCAAALTKTMKIKPHGGNAVRTKDLAVLRDISKDTPALLTEGGYMDSNNDSPYIRSDEGMQDYADGLIEFIINELGLKKKEVIQTSNPTNEGVKTVEGDNKPFEIPAWGIEPCKWATDIGINDGVFTDLQEVKDTTYIYRYHLYLIKLLKSKGLVI